MRLDWPSLRPVVDAYARGRISWDELVALGKRWIGGARDLSASLPMAPQQRALAYVREHPGCTIRELTDALCVRDASTWIAYLRDAGRVRTERQRGRLRIWLVEPAPSQRPPPRGPGVSRAPRAGGSATVTPTAALGGSRRRPPRG